MPIRNNQWIKLILLILCLGLNAAHADNSKVAEPITSDAYKQFGASKGVVLFAVRWDRKWSCGEFENAQLRVIGFDKLPSQRANDDEAPDILLDDAPLIMTKPVFENYALLVEPGDYGLSSLHIKVARSVSDVGVFKIPRSTFLKDGRSLGGTFKVGPGEIVYIGHFYLDCYKQPTLWRFYSEDRDAFDRYLASVKKEHPELDVTKAQFRLFQTTEFGYDYQLP